MLRVARLLVGVAALWATLAAGAQQAVSVPSLDRAAGRQVVLTGVWLPSAEIPPGGAPAMLLLHGCGGMYARGAQAGQRRLSARMLDLSRRLGAMGVNVLVLDSLSARGQSELCTQQIGKRSITQHHRRLDALGAVQWMAAQPGVDVSRLGMIGWSNGGSTVLAATNLRHPEVRRASHRPNLAVAFYPGCEAALEAGYEAVAPLLLMTGALDDWTPSAPCEALAASAAPATIQIAVYPDAYHGFDGTTAVRLRTDVPNGTRPGQGVHVGGHAPSREAAHERLDAFLKAQWRLP